ncbi:hypothetical protein IS811_001442 [Staphylococcus pseudintermedius]|nr:hypothetical protein [Staphylococcus pseudintermedius]
MSELMDLKDLIYSRDELLGVPQEGREEQREFADAIKEFNYVVEECKHLLSEGVPVIKEFNQELSDEELEVFYNAGYILTSCLLPWERKPEHHYSIKLRKGDYNDLNDLNDLDIVVDKLRDYLKWHDIKLLVKESALYKYTGEDIHRGAFITALQDILYENPKLEELLKLK